MKNDDYDDLTACDGELEAEVEAKKEDEDATVTTNQMTMLVLSCMDHRCWDRSRSR